MYYLKHKHECFIRLGVAFGRVVPSAFSHTATGKYRKLKEFSVEISAEERARKGCAIGNIAENGI